jgi:hypothetical protein
LALAAIVADCEVLTDATFAVKDVLEAPEATVTLAGTVTAASLLATVTPSPADGAAELSETVHVVVLAPVKELAAHASALTEGANCDPDPLKVIVVVFDEAPCAAVRVTVWEAATADTFAAKLALVVPEGTETDAGTVTAPLLLVRLTAMPLLGAGAVNVTLQESEPVPVINEFAQLRDDTEAVVELDPLPCNFTEPPTLTFVAVIAFTLSSAVVSVAAPGS